MGSTSTSTNNVLASQLIKFGGLENAIAKLGKKFGTLITEST